MLRRLLCDRARHPLITVSRRASRTAFAGTVARGRSRGPRQACIARRRPASIRSSGRRSLFVFFQGHRIRCESLLEYRHDGRFCGASETCPALPHGCSTIPPICWSGCGRALADRPPDLLAEFPVRRPSAACAPAGVRRPRDLTSWLVPVGPQAEQIGAADIAARHCPGVTGRPRRQRAGHTGAVRRTAQQRSDRLFHRRAIAGLRRRPCGRERDSRAEFCRIALPACPFTSGETIQLRLNLGSRKLAARPRSAGPAGYPRRPTYPQAVLPGDCGVMSSAFGLSACRGANSGTLMLAGFTP